MEIVFGMTKSDLFGFSDSSCINSIYSMGTKYNVNVNVNDKANIFTLSKYSSQGLSMILRSLINGLMSKYKSSFSDSHQLALGRYLEKQGTSRCFLICISFSG